MDSLSAANTAFALNLLKKLSANDPTKNLFFSPLSVSSALLMVSLGAKGNTEAQMSKVLSVSKDREVHQKFEKHISEIIKPGANYTLSLANRLFGEKSYDFLASFIESTEKLYHAGLEKLNFKQASEDSRRHINGWVEEKTSGKIQDLLVPGLIDSLTKLVLVNAIYFKGNWADRFNKDHTVEKPFWINKVLAKEGFFEMTIRALVVRILLLTHSDAKEFYSPSSPEKNSVPTASCLTFRYRSNFTAICTTQNESKTVQMMFNNATYNMAHISAYRTSVLELPYVDNKLSMIVLLPDEIADNSTGLEKLEREITYEKLMDWINPEKMFPREIELSFPKFKLEEKYDLKPVLRSMGMMDAFDEGKADFSGMSTNKDLVISEVVHKSFIEVSEEGTEAAAATGLIMIPICEVLGFEFKADHPFLFFIIQRSINGILFFGRYCSP